MFVFTLIIHYPSDVDVLMRLSKRLFVAYYACGLVGTFCLVTGFVVGFSGGPLWLAAALIVLTLILGAVMNGLEFFMSQVDMRRFFAAKVW